MRPVQESPRQEVETTATTGRAAPRVAARAVVDGMCLARAGRKLCIRGVTYGPFAPNGAGEPFPPPEQVRDDFGRMQAIGVNSVRTYHRPPEWLLDLAD